MPTTINSPGQAIGGDLRKFWHANDDIREPLPWSVLPLLADHLLHAVDNTCGLLFQYELLVGYQVSRALRLNREG